MKKARIIASIILLFTFQLSYSVTSYTSRSNYTGAWETDTTWIPTWSPPLTSSFNFGITINGYISCNESLTFSGASDTLQVNDTLVIHGDLTLGNNSHLVIGSNGILIIRGNLNAGNQSNVIINNGYLIVTGNYTKTGMPNSGSFTSTSSPTNVFIGGTATSGLDTTLFSVLDCPGSNPYPNSGCSYGNMTDLAADPIYPFFQSTCTPTIANAGADQTGTAMCGLISTKLAGNTPTIGTATWSLVSGTGGSIVTPTNPVSNFKGLAGNTYVLSWTITENSCSTTDTVVVQFKTLPVATITVTDTSGLANNDSMICSDGSATLTASGGVSYSWSTGENVATIIKDTAGTYSVTVTGSNGCQDTASAALKVYAVPVPGITVTDSSGTTNNDGILCSGDSATLLATGATSFKWSSGDTTASITKGVAGIYSVTVTDTNGCYNTANTSIIVNPLPVAGITVTDSSGTMNNDGIICSGDSASFIAFGGVNYSWSTGESIAQIRKNSAGNYTVTVTDVNGCQDTANSSLTVNPLPVAGITVIDTSGTVNNDGIVCNGDYAALTASGGVNYSWSSGDAGAVITKNSAGKYTVTVTDGNGCNNTADTSIVVNPLPVAGITVTDSSGTMNNDGIICSGDSASLIASGGVNYNWSTGESVPQIRKNSAGNYTVTVTDVNGCQDTANSSLTVNLLPVAGITVIDTSGAVNNDGIVCNGDYATLTASGGVNYSWSSGDAGAVIIKNSAGKYTVTVTDGNGCLNTADTSIIVNPLPVAGITVTDNSGTTGNDGILCSGDSATLLATGGSAFKWSSGETTASVTKGTAGIYSALVTDTNGCSNTANTSIIVNPLPVAGITVTDNSGTTNNDGIICSGDSAILAASGGSGYLWSTGSANSSISVLTGGNYVVTVTDVNACQNSATSTVTVNPLPVAGISVTDNSGIANNDGIICSGDAATLTASGGKGYIWSDGETSPGISMGVAGNYAVTVTDINGCRDSASTSVTVNALPVAAISITDNSGVTNNDGVICEGDSAALTASGGKSFAWSSGEKAPMIVKALAGNYTVTVTDVNGCMNSAGRTVTVTARPNVNAGTDDNVCGPDYTLGASSGTGTGTWNVASGPGNVTFSPDANDPQAKINISSYGAYQLTWTAVSQNCPASDDVTINFQDIPGANAGNDQDLNNAFTTQMAASLSSSQTGEWSLLSGSGVFNDNGSPDATVSDLSPGENMFLWTVTSNQCTSSDSVKITVNDLFVPQVITPNNDGKNDYFVIKDIDKKGPADLIIFDRWGNEVYHNTDYNNEWDGRNDSGTELANDTYFYILRFPGGKPYKGFVVIKR